MPPARLTHLLKRLTQTTRGRVDLLLFLLALVWLGSAFVAYYGLGAFSNLGEALWSGITHLLDPSSLREDDGFSRRAVGLFQVVFGLIFLVGLAFTVIAEVVGTSLERLGQFDPPVRCADHLLLIGGPEVAAAFLGRLSRAAAEDPEAAEALPHEVVLLAPPPFREGRRRHEEDLRAAAAGLRVRLVIGDTKTAGGFELARARDARTIVVGSSSARTAAAIEAGDLDVIQTGVALRAYLEAEPSRRSPGAFLTFRRARNVEATGALIPPSWTPIVADRTLASLLLIAVLRPPFGSALPLIDPLADGVYPVAADSLIGVPFADLAPRFERALPLGLLRGDHLQLAPVAPVAPDDQVVVLAPNRTAAARLRPGPHPHAVGGSASNGRLSPALIPTRLLIVGWNDLARELVVALGRVFAAARAPGHVTVLATGAQLGASLPSPSLPHVSIDRVDGVTSDPDTLREAVDRVRPDGVVVVASPVPGRDTAQADAEGVLTVMQLRRLTWQADTPIVGQVYAPLQGFDLKANPWLAVISSQHVMSSVLALVVFQSLPAAEHLLGGEHARLEVHHYQSPGDETTFGEIYDRALADGTVVLGLARDGETARLNPRRDTRVRPGDKLLLAHARASHAETPP